jgi:hypothetical protein
MYYEQDQDIIEDQFDFDEENMAALSSLGGGIKDEDEEDDEEDQIGGSSSSVFAAAEEFADLLGETETSGQVRQRSWEDKSAPDEGRKRKGNNFKRKIKKFKQ